MEQLSKIAKKTRRNLKIVKISVALKCIDEIYENIKNITLSMSLSGDTKALYIEGRTGGPDPPPPLNNHKNTKI